MAAKKGSRRAQVQAALDSWLDATPEEKAPRKKKAKRRTRTGKGSADKSTRTRAPEPKPEPSPTPAPEPPRKKIQATFQLPPELLEEARDTVVALAGPPESLTLATLVARGIERELAALRERYNDGERFPERKAPLRQGRPIGS